MIDVVEVIVFFNFDEGSVVSLVDEFEFMIIGSSLVLDIVIFMSVRLYVLVMEEVFEIDVIVRVFVRFVVFVGGGGLDVVVVQVEDIFFVVFLVLFDFFFLEDFYGDGVGGVGSFELFGVEVGGFDFGIFILVGGEFGGGSG